MDYDLSSLEQISAMNFRLDLHQIDFGDKFEVIEEVGRGGMGTVLKVRHRAMKRIRAVKVMNTCSGKDVDRGIERFRREAIIVSELSHPNIVKVFDLDTSANGIPYMIMEYLEGEDLEFRLHKEGQFGLLSTVEMLAGVADALDMVHQAGIVHRDLKPSNLFIARDGVLKILDFGISHVDDGRVRLTIDGNFVGTPMYMAPELLKMQGVDGRADVYSLAVVVYEMLTGYSPFDSSNTNVVMAQVMTGTPRPIEGLAPDLPPHVGDVMEKALAKDPDARYQTAREFIRELAGPLLVESDSGVRRCLMSDEIALDAIAKVSTWKNGRQRILSKIVLLGLLVVLVISAALGIFFSPKRAEGYPITVAEVRVDAQVSVDPWIAKAVTLLVSHHLEADSQVQVVQLSSASHSNDGAGAAPEGTSAAHNPGQNSGAPSLRLLRLNVALSRSDDAFTVQLSLTDPDASKHIWTGSGSGEGVEPAVERATWALARFVENNTPVSVISQTARERCGTTERCTEVIALEDALLGHGLLNRVDRLADILDADPSAALWPAAVRYLRCLQQSAPSKCLDAVSLGAPASGLSPDRQVLWRLLSGMFSGGADDSTQPVDTLCNLIQSEDPFVRGIARFLPERDLCVGSRLPICANTETFLDRLGCLNSSAHLDDPEAVLTYFKRFVEKDNGHGMIIAAAVLLILEQNHEGANQWLERTRLRHGDGSPLIADSMFLTTMHDRDKNEALVWARRSPRALMREGLALQLDGWLRSGVVHAARGAAAELASEERIPGRMLRMVIGPTLHPVLLAGSTELAEAWLEGISAYHLKNAAVKAAVSLVETIRDGNEKKLCRTPFDADFPWILERLYLCERWEEILKYARIRGDRGVGARIHRFLVAEAQLNLGMSVEAVKGFSAVEADPSSRALEPFTALLALERLGRLAEKAGDTAKARGYYDTLLKAWNGLDTPLPLQQEIFERRKRMVLQ